MLSVAGLASDFLAHLLSSVDGLLLLMISLMMAGIFALMLFVIASDAGWIPSRHKNQEQPAASVKAPAVSAAPAKATVGVPVGTGSREGK